MSRDLAIQDARQIHLLHQGQEYHKIIDTFCCQREIFFHASQYAREFPFCLSPYANGEHLFCCFENTLSVASAFPNTVLLLSSELKQVLLLPLVLYLNN